MRKQRVAPPNSIFQVEAATKAAWWLLAGTTDPGVCTRFAYNSIKDEQLRAFVIVQVSRIMEEAEIAGIGNVLTTILDRLSRLSPISWDDFHDGGLQDK